jgi:cytochrome c-type biogenesis protein CcmH
MIRSAPSIGALLLALALWAAMAVNAAAEPTFETRLKNLEAELRCLVCQNQTLADSNASLADDLRNEVRTLATAGKSDDEIRAYLVARYGDFVLYDPPLKRTTALLWVGPFALLALGATLWWFVLRRREQAVLPVQTAVEVDAERRARVLLDAPDADPDKTDDGREPKDRA